MAVTTPPAAQPATGQPAALPSTVVGLSQDPKADALCTAFSLGWTLVELISRIRLSAIASNSGAPAPRNILPNRSGRAAVSVPDPLELITDRNDSFWLASTWRSRFNYISGLHQKAFPESTDAETLYAPPGCDILPYLYPPSPDFADIGISGKDAKGDPFLAKFQLYDVTRRAVNCLTLLYVDPDQSLIPDAIRRSQGRLISFINWAAQNPAAGGGDAGGGGHSPDAANADADASQKTDQNPACKKHDPPEPNPNYQPTPAEQKAAFLNLSELTVKFLEAWDGYLRENYFAGGVLKKDETELVAYEAGRSLAGLSWGMAMRTAKAKANVDAAVKAKAEAAALADKDATNAEAEAASPGAAEGARAKADAARRKADAARMEALDAKAVADAAQERADTPEEYSADVKQVNKVADQAQDEADLAQARANWAEARAVRLKAIADAEQNFRSAQEAADAARTTGNTDAQAGVLAAQADANAAHARASAARARADEARAQADADAQEHALRNARAQADAAARAQALAAAPAQAQAAHAQAAAAGERLAAAQKRVEDAKAKAKDARAKASDLRAKADGVWRRADAAKADAHLTQAEAVLLRARADDTAAKAEATAADAEVRALQAEADASRPDAAAAAKATADAARKEAADARGKAQADRKFADALASPEADLQRAWQQVFSPSAIVHVQHQIAALSTALDDAYYRLNPKAARPAADATLIWPNPDLPSQAIKAVTHSLDYWERSAAWITGAAPAPAVGSEVPPPPPPPPFTVDLNEQMCSALRQQADVWQSLLTAQQSLRAYTLESMTKHILDDAMDALTKNVEDDLRAGGAAARAQAWRDLGPLALLGLFVVVVVGGYLIGLHYLTGSNPPSDAVVATSGTVPIVGLLLGALGFRNGAAAKAGPAVAVAAPAGAAAGGGGDLLSRLGGLVGGLQGALVQAYQDGYQQVRIEFVGLSQSFAVGYPLVEFFVITPAMETVTSEYTFLTEIIWSGTDRAEEARRVVAAAFGPFRALLGTLALGKGA